MMNPAQPTSIQIVSPDPHWREEFRQIAVQLRQALGSQALRIDHIGSTAVAGLPAKDRIDIQITVSALTSAIEQAIEQSGYPRVPTIDHDHLPAGGPTDPTEWQKWLFKSPEGKRPANIHVRLQGRANQRYALLFRDYLRAHPMAAQTYAQIKQVLARLHPDDIDAYYDVKDPVCDLILQAAELWATACNWHAGQSDA